MVEVKAISEVIVKEIASNAVIDAKVDKQLVLKKNQPKVLKKDYVLNDMEALKKKLDNARRNPGIEISGEAVDSSCVTIGVKTALYEYFKSSLMEILGKDSRIANIKPIQKVIADTNFNGEASVEYQLEIIYLIDGNEHQLKILCFSTTCNIMVQNMGRKTEPKTYFQNRHSAKYFAEEFLLTIGHKALEDVLDMDDRFIPTLKSELKRMQELLKWKMGLI